MKYIVYLDVFFVVNLVMDLILLRVAAFYIKPQTTWIRCLLGSTIGSLVTTASLLLSYEHMLIHMLVTYIFTVSLMVYITYGKTDIKSFLMRVGWLYLVTIIFGGAMNLLYDYTYFGYVLHGILGSVYSNPLNLGKMLIFTGGAYLILNGLAGLWIKKKQQEFYVRVVITLKGRVIELLGLVDSGNTLNCPYSGKPVHIASTPALQKILEGVDIHQHKYRLVPFHSLGRRNGLVEVVEFDEILVYKNDEAVSEQKLLYYEKSPAVGLYHDALSGEQKYQMLVHSIAGRNRI